MKLLNGQRVEWRWSTVVVMAGLLLGCAGDRPTVTGELLLEEIEVAAGPSTAAAPAVSPEAEPEPTPIPVGATALEPEPLKLVEVEVYPHDSTAFTQGLLVDGDQLLESTGQPNESTVRRVQIESGEVLQSVDVPVSSQWGEGLARVGDRLLQLTYLAEVVYYWDANSLELLGERSYEGEGWGLCYDGDRVIMSNGSDQLIFRDPDSFDEIGRQNITLRGEPLAALNELECVDGEVWANIFTTNLIVRIDPATGEVTGTLDASDLGQPRPASANVLNGIAFDPSNGTFLLTGKDWPTMHRVRIVPN